MSTLSETSLPFLASVLPNTSTTNILLASLILILIAAYLAFLASPARLTRVLAALLDETERVADDPVSSTNSTVGEKPTS
ncbi:hypothetical protein B0H17DRAFT_1197976 [Mycena rosella]|uniref:Uncharacterized protein n=1 Tax=Mycena rosella TaxID=1033263 RepID=A0AAD7DR83_MYCRO|nr:hypothetical protein B0H17DRAFT_1197976 [Mycena rosella]